MSIAFTGRMAQLQQAAARTADYAARRAAMAQAIRPLLGETLLEIGCGGGDLLRDLAEGVGTNGRVCGIDLSADQIAAAQANCSAFPNVELEVGSALELPYPAAAFDAVVTMQVLEYMPDVPRAVAEMRRVLRAGGRVVNFATNWGALYWNSSDPARTRRILNAFDAHAPHPNMPAQLGAILELGGFRDIQRAPMTILNTSYGPESLSHILAHMISAFLTDRALITQSTAEQWLADLADMDARHEYMFCSTAVITQATAQSRLG